ncbi:MAG: hypothetical protein JNL83_21170 [Myxococcales bacterium]|nr:hypothetical protein [Myxococcales bacterium]
MRKCLALIVVAACGTPPKGPVATKPEPVAPPPDAAPRPPDPDLNRQPPAPLLSIDWTSVPLSTEAEANAVWAQIAPTGEDWEAKLDEIPVAKAGPLAVAMLRAGNFTCVPPQPPRDCAPLVLDVDGPAPTAGMSDPCLRRLLALWSLGAVEDSDLPQIYGALKQIAAIPPPESQLVAAAIQAVPETDHDKRLELLSIAFQAGQRDLANGHVGSLDEPHLIDAATKHHLDGALDALAVESHRAVFLTAIADDKMSPKARAEAIQELVAGEDKLAPDARAALIAATKAKDCYVAAAAVRALEVRGDRRAVPKKPRTRSPDVMMRALCVLAAYERFQGNDESSLLPGFVPPKGLEHVKIAFDALSDTDPDGDGDPHTERTVTLIPKADVVVPEVDDMVRAFRRCKGTTCSSNDRDFRFGLKLVGGELTLATLELIERPPCPGR